MMVEFRSSLDSGKSRALIRYSFKKILWLYLLLSAILIGFGLLGIFSDGENSDLSAYIGLIVLGAAIPPLGYALSMLFQKINDKASVFISSQTEEVYSFDEQGITIVQKREGMFDSTLKASYLYLYKAVEDKNYYFLFISKMQSHVINKNSITQGTIEEMNALLSAHLGSKFKRKK